MRRAQICFLPLLLACGAETTLPIIMEPPATQPDPVPSADCASAPAQIQATGEVSGFWGGRVALSGETTIGDGKRLEICPGASIEPSADAKLIVKGELAISGTADAIVTFAQVAWLGIDVQGKLSGGYFSLGAANVCVDGKAGSEIELVSTALLGCGQPLRVANGARFDRLTVRGGGSMSISGGILTMTDSTVDFARGGSGPDCIVWNGGGANFDHVRVTGCHCPLHMNNGSEGIQIVNSVLESPSVPFMIANTNGAFNNNNILGGVPQLMDVGGNIAIDAGGNYWGGGPAKTSGDSAQYRNISSFATSPIEGAGPR